MYSSPVQLEFSRRSNTDRTTSSICMRCYMTVGTATWADDLMHVERAHRCDPNRVRQFQLTKAALQGDVDPAERQGNGLRDHKKCFARRSPQTAGIESTLCIPRKEWLNGVLVDKILQI